MKLLAAVALVLVLQAHAQTVWRCGSTGNSYSNTPCAEGRALPPSPAPTAPQAHAAHDAAERQRRLALALSRERMAREARSSPAAPSGFAPATAAINPAAAASAKRQRRPKTAPPEEPGTWRAVAPASPRTKG